MKGCVIVVEDNTIKVTLPDNSVREYAPGILLVDIAKSISHRLAREALAAGLTVDWLTWVAP